MHHIELFELFPFEAEIMPSTCSALLACRSSRSLSQSALLFVFFVCLLGHVGVHCVQYRDSPKVHYTLLEDMDLSNNSYRILMHSHRHPHLNETYNCDHHTTVSTSHHARPIQIVVLAPYQSDEEYSLDRIMPSILAAVSDIVKESEHPNGKKYLGWEHGAQIYFVNTKCSSDFGPLAAFDFFTKRMVDVFLGPVCPYVLAPVARYTSYWDVPHLTSSGQVTLFDDKNSTFRILTRMNGSFSRMGQFFNQVSKRTKASSTKKTFPFIGKTNGKK